MKKRKAAILMALMMVGMSATNVNAATVKNVPDYADKPISFYVDQVRSTSNYTKGTDSSVYLHVTDAGIDFVKVQAYGYINSAWVNKTVGTTATVPTGPYDSAKRRIRAGILEANNYNATTVHLTFPVNAVDTRVVGKWSPDCKGNYPAAN